MEEKKFFRVPVDNHDKYTPCSYRTVTKEELDKLLEKFGNRVLQICERGNLGAMAMWAVFKSRICCGCYSDMINVYRLLSGDNQSLVDREHELRHAYREYEELWQIRYFGTVEEYYLEHAREAKEHFEKYAKEDKKNG